jgi:hypothetical protein
MAWNIGVRSAKSECKMRVLAENLAKNIIGLTSSSIYAILYSAKRFLHLCRYCPPE